MIHKVKLIEYINGKLTHANTLKTHVNILEFNCIRLTDKIKVIKNHRSKRGIINGLGTIIKIITGNLDSNDNEEYRELFTKIDNNMQKLQTQSLKTIRINKEMILKFNKQIDNLRHNEEVLNIQIAEIKNMMKNIYNWRSIIEIKDALNQLILLTINLIEIIYELETSLTFCSINKIHSSIIDFTTLKKNCKR